MKKDNNSSSNKLRVALDVSQMVYHGHGVGRYTEELARALLNYRQELDLTFYAGALRQGNFLKLRRRQQPWRHAAWRIVPLPPRLAPFFWHTTNLPLELVTGSQDVVHLSDWTTPHTNAPCVTTVHDLVYERYPETVPSHVLRAQRTRITRAVKQCHSIIADSISTKNDLVKEYQLRPNQIHVIYPGINSRFAPQKKNRIDQVKQTYQLPDSYLLTLGTREPRKNLPRLIEAHKIMQSKDPSTPDLVIAGRVGWGKELVETEHVHLMGFVQDRHLPGLYSGATAFIYPSLYEGFGFPALESMACGTPAVVSHDSSLPELVGKKGILVDPTSSTAIAQGISRLLHDLPSHRQHAIKRARQFTWDKTAAQTIEVYYEAVGRKGRS